MSSWPAHWVPASAADPVLRATYERHYSRKQAAGKAKNVRFVGPGECMVLRTVDYRALFAWRLSRFRMDLQGGVECTIFRNEGEVRSSVLVLEAVDLAWRRWPGFRLFTFVNPKLVASPNPGYCFKAVGWRFCGRSLKGLHILALNP